MTFAPPEITVNQNDFASVSSRLKSMPAEVRAQVLDEVGAYAVDVLGDEVPDRVDHSPGSTPYIWNSERQRRAFFASDGFGRGIPTERTNAMADGWDVDVTPYGAKITNSEDYAGFVMGEAQQLGHKADGWKKVQDLINGKLSFRSSRFRDVVMGAYQAAIRKLKLG